MDVSRAEPNRLVEMGMVRTFQIPRPFRELTVHDNVAVGTLFDVRRATPRGSSEDGFVEQILKDIGLFSARDKLAGELGYGNLKLLELGRARGTRPELLLLDEPFGGLSAKEIGGVSELIRRLAEEGLTLIIVEHKLRELMRLVQRVIVLHYGEKIADGRPDEISRNEQVLKAYLGRRWRGGDA
jgi:branched-chain amino acid transport system ATP-binding protein